MELVNTIGRFVVIGFSFLLILSVYAADLKSEIAKTNAVILFVGALISLAICFSV
jgi:hypothetical protein